MPPFVIWKLSLRATSTSARTGRIADRVEENLFFSNRCVDSYHHIPPTHSQHRSLFHYCRLRVIRSWSIAFNVPPIPSIDSPSSSNTMITWDSCSWVRESSCTVTFQVGEFNFTTVSRHFCLVCIVLLVTAVQTWTLPLLRRSRWITAVLPASLHWRLS